MPSGIYQLEFETGERYIGKSVDIPQRWRQHIEKLQKGTAAGPMQDAYYRSGCELPLGSIVLECHPDLLDLYEGMYINLWHPELNTSIPRRLSDEYYEILEKYTRTSNGLIASVPDLIDTAFNLDKANEDLNTALGKATAKIGELWSNWNSKVAMETAKIQAFTNLEADLERERHEYEMLRFRVNKANWWQRLWKTW